jgi:SnoaL-like domain
VTAEDECCRALAERVRAIEDREAIADLVNTYAEFIRNGTPGRCVELMTDDASIELRHADPDRPGASQAHRLFPDRTAIATSFTDMAGSDTTIWAMIHNLRIALEGDRASSTCVMMAAIWPHGKQFVGEYRDSYRRVAGQWRFAARTFINFGDTEGRFAGEASAEFISTR